MSTGKCCLGRGYVHACGKEARSRMRPPGLRLRVWVCPAHVPACIAADWTLCR